MLLKSKPSSQRFAKLTSSMCGCQANLACCNVERISFRQSRSGLCLAAVSPNGAGHAKWAGRRQGRKFKPTSADKLI